MNLCLLTYLLTPWCRVPLEKLTGSHLVKKFPAFYGTRGLNTAYTRAGHLSLSWARSIQSMPPSHFVKIHLNIILLSKPGSLKWPLSLRFPHQNPVSTSLLPHACYVPSPPHSYRFDHPSNWWGAQIFELLLHRSLSVLISIKIFVISLHSWTVLSVVWVNVNTSKWTLNLDNNRQNAS